MRITNKKKFNKYYKNESEGSSDIIENDEYVGEINKESTNILNQNNSLKGITLEERNNYKFFVSGQGYSTIYILGKENNKHLNYNNINIYNNSNNNKKYKRQIYSNFEKENNDKYNNNFLVVNHKTPFDFGNVGIFKDFSNGQLYKIYQAIPIDINNEDIEIELKMNPKYLINNAKTSYGNRNNFFINIIDIDK